MTVFRQRYFSTSSTVNEIVGKLRSSRVTDFDVVDSIPLDSICVHPEDSEVTIYLPEEYEYAQFGIDSFIRSMLPYARSTTKLDRNIYTMKVSSKLSTAQLAKLVKYIIEEQEYCTILG